MADYCYNTVRFIAEPAVYHQIQELFDRMAALEKETGHAQLPKVFLEDEGWMVDIEWEGDLLTYATRWIPNTDVIIAVADHFGAGFDHRFEDTRNHVYGRATYETGRLVETALDDEDFTTYHFDKDIKRFLFEGETYDRDEEILDILLERKRQINELKRS